MSQTIGILGGGQLGRMLALAGIPLGLHFRFLENEPDCPAAAVGEVIIGRYEDPAALERFARGIDVATYEFENVPASTARWLTEHVPVFPPEGVLAIAQERLSEKQLFRELGIATPDFESVDSPEQLKAATQRIGFPCVLKTRRLGYDGKGQSVLRSQADLAGATTRPRGRAVTGQPLDLILESFVPFQRELSIIAVRSRTGEEAFYPLTQNTHREGILRESIAPAPNTTPDTQSRAEDIARRVLDKAGYIGVLAIELFQLADGTLVVNEMAPRVHNSGHWTQDGAPCSQFENHLRAILGWPLGTTKPRGHAAMLNILRALPSPADILSIPGAHLHLYDKQPRPNELRKIGHVNLVVESATDLHARLDQLRSRISHCL